MRSITSYLDYTLTLQQSDTEKSLYELRFGDELLGSINIPKLWSDRAEGESADGKWMFERQLSLKPKVLAKALDGKILASYTPSSFKRCSSIMIGEEEEFFVKKGIFKETLAVSSRFDTQIIYFKNHGNVQFLSEITFSYDAKRIKQLPLVLFLSCYILLLDRRDARRSRAI